MQKFGLLPNWGGVWAEGGQKPNPLRFFSFAETCTDPQTFKSWRYVEK